MNNTIVKNESKNFLYNLIPQDFAKRFKKQKFLLLFILPVLFGMAAFEYMPMYGIVTAFQDFNIVTGYFNSPWVGLKHFKAIFQTPDFTKVVGFTLNISIIRLVIIHPIPIIFALLLNEIRINSYKRFVQSLSYLPHFISWVVTAGLIYNLLSIDGTLYVILKALHIGGENPMYLTKVSSFLPMYFGGTIWKETGFGAIIYLAALTGVDPNLYEAAEIDGATRWQLAWKITVPLILPTIAMTYILAVGGLLGANFDAVYNLQNAATRSDTEVIGTYIYQQGLRRGNYSFSTAFGLFNSVITIFLVTTTNRLSKKVAKVSLW